MLIRSVGVELCIVCLLAACSAAPPARHVVSHDPMLARQDGVLLFADVCIQKDALGDDEDFFVIAESKLASQILLKNLRTYVEDSNISIRGEISAVCAAKQGLAETILAGDNFDAKPRHAAQPLYVQESIKDDKQYINALSDISTYAFLLAAIDNSESTSESDAAKAKNQIISQAKFIQSADIIKRRSSASSILFLGALGTSRSNAKAIVGGLGSFAIGMATAILTAGMAGDYYVIFLQELSSSGRIMEAALIDLESAQLIWSNTVDSPSWDPIEARAWSEQYPLDQLFHDLLFKRTAKP